MKSIKRMRQIVRCKLFSCVLLLSSFLKWVISAVYRWGPSYYRGNQLDIRINDISLGSLEFAKASGAIRTTVHTLFAIDCSFEQTIGNNNKIASANVPKVKWRIEKGIWSSFNAQIKSISNYCKQQQQQQQHKKFNLNPMTMCMFCLPLDDDWIEKIQSFYAWLCCEWSAMWLNSSQAPFKFWSSCPTEQNLMCVCV